MADMDENQESNRFTAEEEAEINKKARILRRTCQPFEEFRAIISVGFDSQDTTRHLVETKAREYITGLKPFMRPLRMEDAHEINTRMPLMAARLSRPTVTPETVTSIADMIQHVANGAKDADTKNMKAEILDLIPEMYLPTLENEDASVRRVATSYVDPGAEGLKEWRGFNHVLTARLLCPKIHIERFKRDPKQGSHDLQKRILRLKDPQNYPYFPVFLYDEDMMDSSAKTGLFRGPLMIKAYRLIFLGKSRSHHINRKLGKKKGNAAIHGMYTVWPTTICYVAIQVYVALSDMQTWGMMSQEVDLSLLYDLLRTQLQNPDDPWVRETLEWWNTRIFPKPDNTDDEGEDLRNIGRPMMLEELGVRDDG